MTLNSPQWRRQLIGAAAELGVSLSDGHAKQLGAHAELLGQWNRKINLTAISDPMQVAVKHYADSLAALKVIGPFTRLIDIGTGAGFPGLALKVVRPDLDVTLVDSVRKKTSFVNHAIRCLGLRGIRAIHARVELLAKDGAFSHAFDIVTSRALAELDRVVRFSMPVLACPGRIIAYQGPSQDRDERDIIAMVDLEKKKIHPGCAVRISRHAYRLPVIHEPRTLAVIDLTHGT